MKVIGTVTIDLDFKSMSMVQLEDLIILSQTEIENRNNKVPDAIYLDHIFAHEFSFKTSFAFGLKMLCYNLVEADGDRFVQDKYNSYRPTIAQLSQVRQSDFMRTRNMGRAKWHKAKTALLQHGYQPIEDIQEVKI